jgi:hypothetical protein
MTARTAWKQALREHGPGSRAAHVAFKAMQAEEAQLRSDAEAQIKQARIDRETDEFKQLRTKLIELMTEEMAGDYPDVGEADRYHCAEQNVGLDAYGYTTAELRDAVARYAA